MDKNIIYVNVRFGFPFKLEKERFGFRPYRNNIRQVKRSFTLIVGECVCHTSRVKPRNAFGLNRKLGIRD